MISVMFTSLRCYKFYSNSFLEMNINDWLHAVYSKPLLEDMSIMHLEHREHRPYYRNQSTVGGQNMS